MNASEHMSVSGDIIAVRHQTRQVDGPATSIAVYDVPGFTHPFEFTAGPAYLGRDVADDLALSLDESFRTQGGQIHVASGDHQIGTAHEGDAILARLSLAFWEGRGFTVKTHSYSHGPLELLAVFEAFHIREHPTGITLTPRASGSPALHSDPLILKEVDGEALLQIMELTRERVRLLPRDQGLEVAGGELFRTTDDHSRSLALITPTSETYILPEEDCHNDSLLDIAGHLEVEWVRVG